MTIRTNLIRNIQSTLGRTISRTTASRSADNDLYEAYTFSLVIEAARNEGATIDYLDINGRTPTSLVFRTSPGFISSTAQSYTYAIIDFRNKPLLEAHIGIFVSGKSGVPHECDVAVLLSDEATLCRQNPGVLPRHSKIILATECKYYTSGLTLGLGRGFLGLLTDTSYSYGERFFVTNTSSISVERLLSKHKKKWDREVIPTSQNAMRLRFAFQEVFKEYKAR